MYSSIFSNPNFYSSYTYCKLGCKVLFLFIFLSKLLLQQSYAQPCKSNGQTQTTINKCVELTSILVDACGTPEGENEILTFKVGKNKIRTTDISVKWSNNSFLGICKNTTTDTIVARINRTIVSCGFLKQPQNGEIPANANVFFFTSTNFAVGSNSFTNIEDTAYAIFQCNGNTSGHFANYSSSGGNRTNILSISGICSDTVTYDRGLLKTLSGSVGSQDGGLVFFADNGSPSYLNNGCNAPFIKVSAKAINLGKDTLCSNDTAFLEAKLKNERCFVWRSAHGKLSDSFSRKPSFVPNKKLKKYVIKLFAWGGCSTALVDSIVLYVSQSGELKIKLDSQFCTKKVYIKTNFVSGLTWQNNGFGNFLDINDTIKAYNFSHLDTNLVQIIASIKDFCGNNQKDTLYVLKPKDSSFIRLSNDTLLCEGETLSINTLTNSIKIAFKHNGTGTLSSPNGISMNYMPSKTETEVKIWAVSKDNCSNAIDSILIKIFKFNTLTPIISDTIVCLGSNSIDLIKDNYLGTFSGLNITGNYFIPKAIGSFPITYQVIKGRCTAKIIKIIVVKDKPKADFTINPSNNLPITEVFTCKSIQDIDLKHQWNAFNFSSFSNEIRYKPGIAGNYFIKHIVEDTTTGCMDTTELNVIVYGEEQIVIPNAFSPNNDSINDFFFVQNNQLSSINLYIYNRWGELIYKTNDLNGKWDGTYQGNNCQDGTYFYLVNCVGISEKKYLFNGVIKLLR